MDPYWLEHYKPISKILLQYGWFVPPYIQGKDFDRIAKYCGEIEKKAPSNDKEKVEVEKTINFILSDIAFHPNFRSFFVYRSKELPHIKEYSHLYENSILNYYKQDYISCVLTMLTIIEGVLLSFYGWQIGKVKKPSFNQLLVKVKKTEHESKNGAIGQAYEMYKETLLEFLSKWIYANTKDADFSLSFLNRHFVLHGMDSKSFYRPLDAHRLILFFDLLIEFLSFLNSKFYNFIPSNELAINFRRSYYLQLIEGTLATKTCYELESEFLNENSNYEKPEDQPNWALSQLNSMLDLIEIMNIAKKNRT